MPIDSNSLAQILNIIIPLAAGWLAKWWHGTAVTKTNQLRAVIDDIDDMVNNQGQITGVQVSKTDSDLKALISKAQGI